VSVTLVIKTISKVDLIKRDSKGSQV